MMVAVLFLGALLASPATGDAMLTGKMAIYNDLLGARWTCAIGKITYFADYTVAPGNALHGHLSSGDGTEDTYFGYDTKRKVYWSDNADSTGATESQMSADVQTFVGTLNDGRTTSKATNVITITSARKWVIRARGTAGGHPYDVTATCLRD